MTDASVPLGSCRPGEAVVVDSVGTDTAFASRLRAMGIQDGVELQVVQHGDTMIVQVHHGNRLCLRGDDVSQVWVSVVPANGPHPAPWSAADLNAKGADARI